MNQNSSPRVRSPIDQSRSLSPEADALWLPGRCESSLRANGRGWRQKSGESDGQRRAGETAASPWWSYRRDGDRVDNGGDRGAKLTSAERLLAAPQRNDVNVNLVTQISNNRLRPRRRASHPDIGRTTAFETRYEVTTHVSSSTLAARLPAMCGMETLTTVVSSSSMKVASITETV